MSEYGNDSIRSLKGADRVRKRPAVIFGSNDIYGCAHAIFEIVSNSLDEARDGHGDKVVVTKNKDGSYEVEDFGRGMPVDWNEREQRFNWELLFCELYAGGKYGKGGANYSFSLGLNGLGLCATQYASEWMVADIYRDKTHYHLEFKNGENVGGLQKEDYTGRRTGSIVKWKPDSSVFTDINVPADYFTDTLKRQAVVNPGVHILFKDNSAGNNYEYYYEHGIEDYVKEVAKEDSITAPFVCSGQGTAKDRDDQKEYKVVMNVAFCFSNQTQLLEYYHNSSWLEHGGSPDQAVKNAFLYAVDTYIKQKSLYKGNESKISFQDVQDCLILVSSCFSENASYENQTKKAINNKGVARAMTDFLRAQLETYFIEKPADAAKIADQVLVNKRSREHAEKTRATIKKALSIQSDMANRVEKFVDCRSKDPEKRELFIVEGDSALGSVKLGRDAEFQAIMPVRGKILNCLKAEYERVFKSQIITDLVRVLGCGVELGGKYKSKDISTFNIDNCKFKKIIFCTDADVDGLAIQCLLSVMFYRLMPSLIKEGYVYIVESPLYEITTKDNTYFAFDEVERRDILKKIGKTKYTIQRSKGLGENEPEMMWKTTMNPETRRLRRLTFENAQRVAETYDLFMGDDLEGRKSYIAAHGSEYMDDLDIS